VFKRELTFLHVYFCSQIVVSPGNVCCVEAGQPRAAVDQRASVLSRLRKEIERNKEIKKEQLTIKLLES